jgi:ATP-dependent Clp protease ATP-binding subunit ClpB
VWGEVKQHFRPEFLNRIDETVVFHALDLKNIQSIAKIQLQLLEKRLEKLEMKLEVSPEALARTGQGRLRPGVRCAAAEARDPAAHREPGGKLILQGKFGPKDVIPVNVHDGEFSFDRVVH